MTVDDGGMDEGARKAKLVVALDHHRQGRFEAAENLYRQVLADAPGDPDALHLMGALRLAQLKGAEALALMTRALQAKRRFPAAWANRGLVFLRMNKPNEALLDLNQALRQQPAFPEALARRAVALQRVGRPEEARNSAVAALALDPEHAEALAALAALSEKGSDAAEQAEEQILASALHNRGAALMLAGEYGAAAEDFRVAARLAPEMEAITFSRSLVDLTHGDYEAGWPGYEARWHVLGIPPPATQLGLPQWRGEAAIAGKRVLLLAEQGLGDTLHFCRYAPLLAERGAAVTLVSPPAVAGLMRSLPGVVVLTEMPPIDGFDFACPLLSLPLAFGTLVSTIPAAVPYVRADPALVQHWSRRLGPRRGVRIGLVWAGNPEHSQNYQRNIDLAPLLAAVPAEVQIVSLQKQVGTADAALLAQDGRVLQLGTELNDMSDTAAAMGALDVTISVDTSVVHAAGATGCPAWVLVSASPDFRWLLGRSDSPWYPTIRIIRQHVIGDWTDALAEMRTRLVAMVAAN